MPSRLVMAILMVAGLSSSAGAAPEAKPAPAPPAADEILVDNTDSGFAQTGAWRATTAGADLWGRGYLLHAKGVGRVRVTWTLAAPGAGRWQVEARWPAAPRLATNARFSVSSPRGRKEVRASQADPRRAGRFNPLTALDLKGGEPVTVTLTDDADGTVAADAFRLLRLPEGCTGADLLYESTFAASAGTRAKEEWVMEGGGSAEWADGYLRLASQHFTPQRSNVETDHFVFWLKRDFPADLAVEWDFRFPDRSVCPNGLAILFFCARGARGEDLFDPALVKREGIFKQYHSGDIQCYHTSYFAGSRGVANLRKNAGFHLVASAEDRVAQGGPEKWHRLRLTRFGAAIALSVDGRRCLTWNDDGKTYGPLLGGGKIGLRQQNDLLHGDYTNLRVWALKR